MFRFPPWILFFGRLLLRSKTALFLITSLTVLGAISGAAAPLLIGRMMDAIANSADDNLMVIAILLLAALLLTEIGGAIRAYVSTKTMIRLAYTLTEEMLTKVLRTSYDFFARTPRGELIQRCTQDTKVIQRFGLSTLPAFAQESLLACIALTYFIHHNWLLAVVLLSSFVLLMVPVHIYGQKRGAVRKELARNEAHLRHRLLERLDAIKQIKIFGSERKEFETMDAEQSHWADLMYKEGIVHSWFMTFPRIPDSLAPALVFVFAGWQIATGQATIGQLVTMVAFIPALNAPVRSFFTLYLSMADLKARIDGMLDYLRLPEEVGHGPDLRKPEHFRGLPIIFSGVCAAGERGEVLHNLHFTIAPGEHVAIVGPSGAGKSTLLKLLLRLQEPAQGEIRIGDLPLTELDATHLRNKVGYVMQESTLFRGSLRDNLTYLSVTDQQRMDAWIQAFGAEDIVANLPEGYETGIGTNGDQLSGGQRQIVSLIRTMLKNPDMLLLDEATSSLDQKSERLILDALAAHTHAITRLTVTHRLRAATEADRILVLNHGTLVESGTHAELMALNGLYASLVRQEEDDPERNIAVLKEERHGVEYHGAF